MSLSAIFDPVARAVLTKPYKETLKGILGHTPFVLKGDVETEIYEDAFNNCQYITGVDMPSVTSVGETAFLSCPFLKSVDLPSATSIGAGAFNSCLSLTSVNMPSVTSIGEGAFRGCYELTKADMPSVTSLGQSPFAYCEALASVNIPSVTSIEEMTFAGCRSLASVNMPLAKSVGMGAFGECKSLTKIDLPSVTSIGQQAFGNCIALTAVILRTTETVCVADLTAFANTPLLRGLGHIYIPASMYEMYRASYETAVNADAPGFFDILFRKIEDYPEICDGTADDNEYYIEWDGNTEGRDVIGVDFGSVTFHYYKVSDLIIDAYSLDSSFLAREDGFVSAPEYNSVVRLDGASVLVSGGSPLVFSGKAGAYSLEGATFEGPSDGTYFANDGDSYAVRKLYKYATE